VDGPPTRAANSHQFTLPPSIDDHGTSDNPLAPEQNAETLSKSPLHHDYGLSYSQEPVDNVTHVG
jgi:hypothetical protein